MDAPEAVIVQGRLGYEDTAAQGTLIFLPARLWIGKYATLGGDVELNVLGQFHTHLTKDEAYRVIGPRGRFRFEFTLNGDGPFELGDLLEQWKKERHG